MFLQFIEVILYYAFTTAIYVLLTAYTLSLGIFWGLKKFNRWESKGREDRLAEEYRAQLANKRKS